MKNEARVLGGCSSNLYYSALGDDQIAFVRRDGNGSLILSIADLAMP